MRLYFKIQIITRCTWIFMEWPWRWTKLEVIASNSLSLIIFFSKNRKVFSIHGAELFINFFFLFVRGEEYLSGQVIPCMLTVWQFKFLRLFLEKRKSHKAICHSLHFWRNAVKKNLSSAYTCNSFYALKLWQWYLIPCYQGNDIFVIIFMTFKYITQGFQ